MNKKSRTEKAQRIRHLLQTESESIQKNTRQFNSGRYKVVDDLENYEALKDEARAIKEDAIENLPALIEQLRDAVEANGGQVYLADDAADANRYIRDVAEAKNADSVVKSKSMTSEEIEINEALHEDDVKVWETDLGEFVLQVADESPSHIVAPAIHKSRDAIADLFNEHFTPDEPLETAEELTAFARDFLGEQIRTADVGMTGANFIAADTGTMVLVTSEGNARKCVVTPDTHVAIAGVEKIVPSVADFQPFVELIGRSGTGQDITSYVSLFRPPVDSPPIDFGTPEVAEFGGTSADDREFHLVLLDNGRFDMREDDVLKETLYCIRCSACLNSCANFQHVGGHAFGGETYSGGIGSGWEAGINGEESTAEFNDFCTGCSRCVNQCPVKIDIPWINTAVRDRLNRGADRNLFDPVYEGLMPDEEPSGLDLQKRFFGNFHRVAKVGSATAPLSNYLANADISRQILKYTLGIDSRRDLPQFKRETLRAWFANREAPSPDNPTREVVLYPDLYTNHVQVERGKATVRTLEALGVDVQLSQAVESGRAPLSQGMIETARQHAKKVYSTLEPQLDAGRDVVVIEPSDLAMFHREYDRLLSSKKYEYLSSGSYEVMEFIYGLIEHGADASQLDIPDNPVAYHAHCQQRTLGLEEYTVSVLDSLGCSVSTSDVECCGMAGSFGYKTEYYELSMDVGSDLGDQFESYAEEGAVIAASGTSCLEQLDALMEEDSVHPVQLLSPSDAA